MPVVNVSFKNTEKELQLYNYINELEKQEKSEFVKRALDYYMSNLKINNKTNNK